MNSTIHKTLILTIKICIEIALYALVMGDATDRVSSDNNGVVLYKDIEVLLGRVFVGSCNSCVFNGNIYENQSRGQELCKGSRASFCTPGLLQNRNTGDIL